MKMPRTLILAAALLSGGGVAGCGDRPSASPQSGAKTYIDGLGSASVADVVYAKEALKTMGPTAVPALKDAAVHHSNPVVRRLAIATLEDLLAPGPYPVGEAPAAYAERRKEFDAWLKSLPEHERRQVLAESR